MRDVPTWTEAFAAYDAIAPRYPRVPRENRINGYLRGLSVRRLLATFVRGQRILELGCGTGEEAIELAGGGIEVVAIDPSDIMLHIARASAEAKGLGGRISFLRAAARDLPALGDAIRAPFDGAFASFSLAYEPDLRTVSVALHRLLKPGAVFLASVPSKICLLEFLLALATVHPALSGRRLGPWYRHRVGSGSVPVRAYTPRSLAEGLSPHFVLRHWEGLAVVVPPPYMNRWFARLDGVASSVEEVDGRLRAHRPFRSIGDHFLAEFRHVASEPPDRLVAT